MGVSKKIVNLTSEKTNLRRTFKKNSIADEFNAASEFVEQKIKKQSIEIRMRHQRERY